MKHFFRIFMTAAAAIFIFAACNKVGDLPSYENGTAVQLTSSSTTLAPAPADSNNTVVTFAWTNPKYAQDSSLYKFVLQLDSAGRGFGSKAYSKTVTGVFSTALLAKELNAVLLSWGFTFNTAYSIDARIISSYGNNNETYTSNTVTLNATPYKVPPKIPVPPALYIVGDLNGWNNSSGLDQRFRFSLIDETTYAGIFYFPGGGGYKLIQELGNWDTQFHMVAGGTYDAGSFVQENADPTFPGAPNSGWYRVTVDFQHGTFSVSSSPARQSAPPANLYIVGDLNGWNNSPGLNPIYKFTLSATDPFTYTLNVNFPGGGGYKLIQELGNWNSQFRRIDGGTATFGEFVQENADPTFIGPASGNYKLTVNMAANYYWVTPQ